jgi:fumarate reductase subunit D
MNKKQKVSNIFLSIGLVIVFVLMVFPTYNIKHTIETRLFDLRLYSRNYTFHEIDFCSKVACFDFSIGELK